MVENQRYDAPDEDDLANWFDGLGLTHPVLVDAAQSEADYVQAGFPTYVVIDREMVIQDHDMWPWNDSFVTGLF